jgi:hypothetical protein
MVKTDLDVFRRPRYDKNKQRRSKQNLLDRQKAALQKIGRPSLNMLQGRTLLPPGSRRGFMPESELALEGIDYNQMNAGGNLYNRPEFNEETQPGGYISPPTPPLGPGESGGGEGSGGTEWDDPNPCDCSCYGGGAIPQGGGCFDWQGQPLGPCC